MKFNEAYKGAFIKAADLNGKARRCTINSVDWETVGDGKKVVARFQETDQGFVINRTNAEILREAFGDELLDWVGQQIILKPDKTTFQGKRVDCIRVGIPAAKSPAPVDDFPGQGDDLNV